MERIRVAALVENHPYDVVGYQTMLESFGDCHTYLQPIDLFIQDTDNRDRYDTVLWFNMNWNEPAEGSPLRKYMLEEIGRTGQGIVLLHHALLSFQGWQPYTEVCGVSDRGGDRFRYSQHETVHTKIHGDHPVTAGLSDFTVVDETYNLGEPDMPGCDILLTTDNPNSLKNICWARQYRKSRVVAYASGHDGVCWEQEGFRTVLHRALQWTANRL